ncbi:substrate-binding domain-containing protein [Paenibacillus tarimensis]|uniref:substrate-binding domain-containing protein n=1 Tax=Paenibacillus tarimensis TaxID=416012 RepID=UPI001F37AE3F|nr:substrate-binding domain-containing protein [Paenibacillus tarimensis]MCF2943091.1 substrate-binding domain-containing protein [Paenibacillus tarimensis]
MQIMGAGRILAVAALLAIAAASIVLVTVQNWKQQQASVIWFMPKTTAPGTEFWQVMLQGVHTAAAEVGAEIHVAGTAEEADVEGQIALLEQAVREKPRAVILAATDYNRLVPAASKVREAGITLVTVDSGVSEEQAASLIATDNYAAGRKAGRALGSGLMLGDTAVIISFVRGSTTAIEREAGVRDSMTGISGLRLLQTRYSDSSVEQAYELTRELLEEEPDLKAIAALNEMTVVGSAKAIEEAGLAGTVRLVGFDSSMDEIAYMERGVLDATVVQRPFNMGYLAVRTAAAAAAGERVEPVIDTGSVVITRANMYTEENQKLLFPFIE